MTDQTSIQFISSALDGSVAVIDTDKGILDRIKSAYPYFVPARYIDAIRSYPQTGFTPALLSDIQPYKANWLLFCNLLEKDKQQEIEIIANEPATEIVIEVIAEKEPVSESLIIDEPAIIVSEMAELLPEVIHPIQEIIEEVLVVNDAGTGEKELVADILIEINNTPQEEENLIIPVISQDYFLHKGEKVAEEINFELNELKAEMAKEEADKALMVMMSFSEWLLHFKQSSERLKEETKDQKALKTMWQKEKLAAAMEEENEEIPENVFEMAVNSISKEEGMASETLADIYLKQGKYDHAIDMYRKLSLRNPQKNTYFARKIEEALKNKQT